MGKGQIIKGTHQWPGTISFTEMGPPSFTSIAGDLNGFKVHSGSLSQNITEDTRSVIIPLNHDPGRTLVNRFISVRGY